MWLGGGRYTTHHQLLGNTLLLSLHPGVSQYQCVASWGLKLRFSTASNYEEASASGCWPDQTWKVQVSLYLVNFRKHCEKLHFVFVLLLVFVSQSSSLYWVTFRRYCEKLHHWEPSIYQSLTTTFFQRMLFLQFIIVRRYITGNPPSQEAFISHWLPHSFLQFLEVDHFYHQDG